jgi:hypothetical protein
MELGVLGYTCIKISQLLLQEFVRNISNNVEEIWKNKKKGRHLYVLGELCISLIKKSIEREIRQRF